MYQKLKNLKGPLRLTLIDSKNKELFLQFEEYCQSIIKHSPKLSLHYDVEILEVYPAIRLDSKESKGNIYYFALPKGEEETVFVETLLLLSCREEGLPQVKTAEFENLRKEVSIKTIIATFCPHCAAVVSLANKVAVTSSMVSSYIYDSSLFPEIAEKYRVTAAPTVIIQEDYFLVGSEAKEKLVEWVKKAAIGQYDADVYKAILKEARAEKLVNRFAKEKEIPKDFLDLLVDPEWPSRLGAMVVLESLVEIAPRLIEKAIPRLLDFLRIADERNKGDVLFLLGLIGDETVLPKLQDIASIEESLLREIAIEAINSIKRRRGRLH